MKQRYRVFRRENGIYYYLNVLTKQRHSLETASPETARRLINAKNEACVQPAINLQIAKAYLAAADSNFVKRTWREVMADFVKIKTGSNRTRSERAVFDKAFDSIRDLQLLETRAEHFLRVLESGKISTNNYLRRFHNFAVDMGWLPWPVMPKRQWPPIHYKEKRAVTREEHELILSRESNPEMRAFLWCCWHIGGSQSDVARLKAEDVDWKNQVVSFFRSKTGTAQIIHFGKALAEVLRDLPGQGLLFLRLAVMDEKHRAALFQRACRRVGSVASRFILTAMPGRNAPNAPVIPNAMPKWLWDITARPSIEPMPKKGRLFCRRWKNTRKEPNAALVAQRLRF